MSCRKLALSQVFFPRVFYKLTGAVGPFALPSRQIQTGGWGCCVFAVNCCGERNGTRPIPSLR